MAVTGGPTGMVPLMARPLVMIAGALPPTAEMLMQAALAVMGRTVRARMLLLVVVIAA
ncbi:hypothetical protein ACQP25_35565 [Microtetraspora malaysiensis]|uniref:hypothetical protein n=1 Tax=Microtetraspora malaysiensis TaxID=161358 RepID=UPI003D9257D3